MLDSGRTDCDESHVTDVKIREKRELSSRLRKSGDDSFGERKARDELAGATSAEVERLKLAEAKRVKFDLREDLRMSEDSDLPSEEKEDSGSEDCVLPWGTCELDRNTPSRVVTRQAGTSARADTDRSENLLPYTLTEKILPKSAVEILLPEGTPRH